MSTSQPDDPLLAHTGSPEAASLLRRNLAAIAEQHRGTSMARTVREVLSGQRDLSALEGEPAFMTLVRRGVSEYEAHLAALSPEEKDRLHAEAQVLLDRTDDADGR